VRSKSFLDSGFFIAWINETDERHARALELLTIAAAKKSTLLTSSLVVSETYTHLLYRYGKETARGFRFAVTELQGQLQCLHLDDKKLGLTFSTLERHRALSLSLVDASNLVFARHEKCQEIWATDREMGIEGAELPLIGNGE
jgi:predicted nucleic acid-binding protein